MPVQRVTKYPLLLSRLLKVTPAHHEDRSALQESRERIEHALEHMNQVSMILNTGATPLVLSQPTTRPAETIRCWGLMTAQVVEHGIKVTGSQPIVQRYFNSDCETLTDC